VSGWIYVAIAALGAAGALARFGLDTIVQRHAATRFPLGTFVVNITGSFLLGLLTGLSVTGDGLLLGGAATLGSFTTFSTWLLESERLGEDGETAVPLLNLAGSLVGGLAAASAGWAIGAAL